MSAMLDKNGGGGMGHSPRPTYSSYDGYTRSNYSSLKDEINRFSEEKKKQIEMEGGFGDPEVNKKKLKEQLDAEINSRVREALDTPPLERIQRNRNKADKEDVDHISQLNAQIMMDLTDKERDYVNSRHWREMQKRRLKNLRRSASEGSGFQKKTSPRLEGELSRSNQDDFPGVLGLDRMPNQAPSLGRWARLENFGIMSQPPKPPKIFSTCTREGYLEALRNGRFPDGSKLTLLHNGKFADKYGVVRDEHGPFWPPDYGPLFPTPKHILAVPATPEYLMTEISVPANKSVDTQQTPYTGNWRGIQIVFDSEKSARDYAQPRVPEGCCPSLTFESRFECGNLRQARRVGQFEYELVLKTDLYTKRHTQWYYFRVKSMVPGVVYKLRIANLLKRDSLYNHGMRPLLYSETKAASEGIGWYRTGHNISYYRNDKHVQCPLLHRELIYYELEFEIEFPHGEDTCYLAHCYPYTFTDLKDDLDLLISDPERSKVVKREVMCETRAGNSCFLLTVTNFDKDDFEKKAVIITARVHPGESNASWMMKGVIDFITSSNSVAKQLRNKFIFKIVPMLNIDGVIVGNYRCSLGARDLNRNYRHPRRESFPTVWHTKAMMAEVALKNEILIYCDLHGHSRKSNVFMYGCSNPENAANMKAFLQERMLPWLMSNKASGKFFFNSCKFHIRRCKEATGRVVMYRQYSISNSFTMEATFSGTAITHHNPRHFNQSDFMEMGDVFCQVVLEYEQLQQNKSKQSEIILELTRELTHQILESRGMLPQQLPLLSPRGGAVENGSGEDAKKQGFQKITDAIVAMITKEERADQSAKSKKPASPSDINLRDKDEKDVAKMNVDELIENMTSDTIDGCIHLLEQLKVNELVNESESSDSDSESDDPEVPPVKEPKPKKKKKRKSKKQKESFHRPKNLTPEVIPESRKKTKSVVEFDRPKSAALPAIHTPRNSADEVKRSKKQLNPLQAPSSASSARPVKVKSGPLFINRYEGRSNGGIPCFSQERCSERAAKRMSDMRKRMEEERQKESYYLSEEARYKRYMALTHTMQMQKYQTQEDIRQTFHSAMYDGPIKTHYHHGGDLSPRLLAVGSPVSPNGIKQFEASESDSLSGFDSDHHNPPGAGGAAPLPLSALSTPYTNRCTTPPPPLIPVPVYQPLQQLITDVDPQVTKYNSVFGKFSSRNVLKSKPPFRQPHAMHPTRLVHPDEAYLAKLVSKVNDPSVKEEFITSAWDHLSHPKTDAFIPASSGRGPSELFGSSRNAPPHVMSKEYTDALLDSIRHITVTQPLNIGDTGVRWSKQERHSTCE